MAWFAVLHVDAMVDTGQWLDIKGKDGWCRSRVQLGVGKDDWFSPVYK